VVPAYPLRLLDAPASQTARTRANQSGVERIAARAKGEGRPFHRIIVDELALFPHLDRQARLGELVRNMETVLARYGSRTTVTEVNEALLLAVDEALAARTDG